MHKSKIELHRCFISSIDSAKKFVDYNEYILDPEGELFQYILSLISLNYDNVTARRTEFSDDSFLAQIIPTRAEDFDAFVDVIADEIHTLLGETTDLPAGSGLFIWALADEQPIIAFFKLNFQSRYGCVIGEDGKVSWQKNYRLLPSHTQKEYDYFFIHLYDKKVWMSDTICHIGSEPINYMANRILKLEKALKKSEKETVSVIENVVLDTIKECYKQEAPQKIFEYRQSIAEEAEDYGNISPAHMEKTVFADNEKALETYREKLEERDIPANRPVEVGKKMQRKLKKKQKIVTENGIEIMVPIEFLEDKNVFTYQQEENGSVSIVIHDVKGNLK